MVLLYFFPNSRPPTWCPAPARIGWVSSRHVLREHGRKLRLPDSPFYSFAAQALVKPELLAKGYAGALRVFHTKSVSRGERNHRGNQSSTGGGTWLCISQMVLSGSKVDGAKRKGKSSWCHTLTQGPSELPAATTSRPDPVSL